LLFFTPDRLPEVVNSIFNADFVPPVVWAHTGIVDLGQLDRLHEAGILAVMDRNLMDMHKEWCRIQSTG
jgi:predicted CoA-binding protein